MLLLGRALVLQPEIIMLDEPSLGLAPSVARQIFDIMDRLRRAGMTIILVEQNARMGLKFADWGCVLDLGKAVFEGPSRRSARRPAHPGALPRPAPRAGGPAPDDPYRSRSSCSALRSAASTR